MHMRAVRGTITGEQLVHPPELRLALRLRPEQHGLALLADRRRVRLAGGQRQRDGHAEYGGEQAGVDR
jgi:hypothetical protein